MFINTMSALSKNLFIPPNPIAESFYNFKGAWDFSTSACLNTIAGGLPGPLNVQGISTNDIGVPYTSTVHSYLSTGGYNDGPCISCYSSTNKLSLSQFSSPIDFSNGIIISGCINYTSPRLGDGPFIILNDTSVGTTTNYILISLGYNNDQTNVLLFRYRINGVTYDVRSRDADIWNGFRTPVIATNGVPTFFVITIEFLATTQVITCYQSGRSITWKATITNMLPSYFTHMDQFHISSYSYYGIYYNQSNFDNICLLSDAPSDSLIDYLLNGNI